MPAIFDVEIVATLVRVGFAPADARRAADLFVGPARVVTLGTARRESCVEHRFENAPPDARRHLRLGRGATGAASRHLRRRDPRSRTSRRRHGRRSVKSARAAMGRRLWWAVGAGGFTAAVVAGTFVMHRREERTAQDCLNIYTAAECEHASVAIPEACKRFNIDVLCVAPAGSAQGIRAVGDAASDPSEPTAEGCLSLYTAAECEHASVAIPEACTRFNIDVLCAPRPCEPGARRCILEHVQVCTSTHQWRDDVIGPEGNRRFKAKCAGDGGMHGQRDCNCDPGDPLCSCLYL